MSRERIDPDKAAVAVIAVRGDIMSIWHAAETFAVSKSSIYMRLKDVVSMDPKAGLGTVLTRGEEAVLVGRLLRAGRHQLAWGRSEMVDVVRTLYLDDCTVPWSLETGPGRR